MSDPWHAPRSRSERRDAATATFRRFVPDAEPERVAASLERRLGALGSFVFEAVGDMWNRPGLSRRDRSLFIIATLAAQSRDDELVTHTTIGLRHGLTRSEIEEVVLHVAAYVGFPAAMAANRHIDAALCAAEGVEHLEGREPAEPKSDDQRDADAAEVLATLTGRPLQSPTVGLDALESQLGGVGVVAYRWAFGEIWARDELSRRDRSLVVIAILVSLALPTELELHLAGGLRHGLSSDEIEELITHLSLYAGLPRAVEAMRVARRVFAEQ